MSPAGPSLQVVETFTSIQGESTHAGRVCFFIRLAGCNLCCSYCDTAYAQEPCSGHSRCVEELLTEVRDSGVKLVELTGGEPLLQPETPELAQMLLADGCEVLIETNGSLPIDVLPEGCKRIVDVKLPSSGMAGHIFRDNYAALRPGDELKFVTGSRADFDFAANEIHSHHLDDLNIPLIFSPVFGAVAPAELAKWVIAAPWRNRRMQLQMHKFIWDPARRGV